MVIDPIDEITFVGYRWLEQHGYGSRTTVWRKVKSDPDFPQPVDEGKWTLAQIKQYVAKKINHVTESRG